MKTTVEELVEALRAGGHVVHELKPWPGERPSVYEEKCPCGEVIELFYVPEKVVDGRASLFARCVNKHLHGWHEVWADLPKGLL